MISKIKNLKQITHDLAPIYIDNIENAGPVMGALLFNAYLFEVDSPPAPSPVGAQLIEFKYAIWQDISTHLRSFVVKFSKFYGRPAFDAWSKRILQLCNDPFRLIAITVPLFLDGQMHALSPSPYQAQDILLRLMSPVVDSNHAPIYKVGDSFQHEPNAKFAVFLIAGKTPFVLTCHSGHTVKRWSPYLEAATVLLIPQVTIAAENDLSEDSRTFMFQALKNEMQTWAVRRPKLGEVAQWSWLPKLM
jgi:hypothetical protein